MQDFITSQIAVAMAPCSSMLCVEISRYHLMSHESHDLIIHRLRLLTRQLGLAPVIVILEEAIIAPHDQDF